MRILSGILSPYAHGGSQYDPIIGETIPISLTGDLRSDPTIEIHCFD